MVRGGGGDEPGRARNRAVVQLHSRPRRPHLALEPVVPVDGPRVPAIGHYRPRVVRFVRASIDVVPSGVDDPAVVGDAGVPFVRLVEAERHEVAAIGVHRVQRVGRHVPPAVTAAKAAAALRDEHDPAVGQEAGIEVVPAAIGQLPQLSAVHTDAEDVEAALRPAPAAVVVPVKRPRARLCVGEEDRPSVERQLGRDEGARLESAAREPPIGHHHVGEHILKPRLRPEGVV